MIFTLFYKVKIIKSMIYRKIKPMILIEPLFQIKKKIETIESIIFEFIRDFVKILRLNLHFLGRGVAKFLEGSNSTYFTVTLSCVAKVKNISRDSMATKNNFLFTWRPKKKKKSRQKFHETNRQPCRQIGRHIGKILIHT